MKVLRKVKRRKASKRHIVLLEVLIAFALIVLCALPLISSHVQIYKAQKQFISKIELDHVINRYYAHIYELLQKNEIPWQQIENQTPVSIDPNLLKEFNQKRPLPYTGTYQFIRDNYKPKSSSSFTVYLYTLRLTFKKGEATPLEYDYKVFIVRNVAEEDSSSKTEEKK